MKALRKDFFREIRHSLSRFLSILILVALAVAFLSGLKSTAPDMKQTCDHYLDGQQLMDAQILSTLGLTREDIALLRRQPGVETVEPAFILDAYARTDSVDLVTKLYSLPEELNRLSLTAGRMPESDLECVVDKALLEKTGLALGDSLQFETSGDLEDALTKERRTVVGVVRSPLYISPERGSSSLGTGQVGAFAYLPKSAFALDFYTAAFLKLEGAEDLLAFSPEYKGLTEPVLDALEPLGKERAKLRRESLVEEGNDKLTDAERELAEAKAEAEQELSDAWEELTDARRDLDKGWRELRDAEETLKTETADAERELAEGEQELADALQELNDGEQEYSDGLLELQDGRREYEDGLAEFEEGKQEYEGGLAEFEEGRQEYEKGKKELDHGWSELDGAIWQFNQGEARLAKAKEELEQGELEYQKGLSTFDRSLQKSFQIDSALALREALNQEVDSGNTHGQIDSALQTQKELIENRKKQLLADAQLESIEAAKDKVQELKAAIQALESGQKIALAEDPPVPDPPAPTLDELKTQLSSLEELIATHQQLEEAAAKLPQDANALQAQLNLGYSEIENARKALDAGRAEYEAGVQKLAESEELIDEALYELRAGQKKLDEAKEELDEAEAKLKDAKEEVDKGQQELDEAKAELEDGERELQEARVDLDQGWADYQQGLLDLEDGRRELKEQVADAKKEIADARKELQDGETEYQDGLTEYEEGKQEAEEKIADAEDKIGDARRKLADIGDSEWFILGRDVSPGYLGFGQDADRMANLASVFPLLFFLVAALVCLTTMTRMVEEQRVQIGSLKALGYSRWAISKKYLGYGFLPALIGGILGLAIGFTLFPKMIFTAYQIMYEVPDIELSIYPGISLGSLLAAVGCTTLSSLAACLSALRETPAALMRPKAPKAGKRVLLEYIRPLWRHMSFNHKVTARNLLRYKKRFLMTVFGIGGCTALIIAGFGLRSSLLTTMGVQYDEIFRYTAQVATSENLLPQERADIEGYIQGSGDIVDSLSCRISTITAESKSYNTSAYLEVVDPQAIARFVNIRDYHSGKAIPFPEEGVIIDQKLAELLDLSVGDRFIADGDGRVELTVAAINENYLAHFIYLSPAYYEAVFHEALKPNAYLLTLESADSELCDRVFTDMMALHGVQAASRMLSTRDTYMSAMERIDFVVVIVILSAAALALVVLYNLSNINMTERKRELATIRVLGFYDKEVSAYVNRENAVLTVFGILFGIFAGRLLHLWLVKSVEIDLMMFGRKTDPMAFLWAALLTLLFSAVVALLSHRKMKKIDMVESLKSAE